MQPGVLPIVDAQHRRMRRLSSAAILASRRAWTRISPDRILSEWEQAVARLLPVFTTLQLQAASAGAEYGHDTLAAQGLRSEPDATVRPEAFVGWASDGRVLETLLLAPLAPVRQALLEELPLQDAVNRGQASLERIAHTQIGDAGRSAAGVDIVTRPNVGWIRMINPPTCSRCLILAGRFYRWNAGFDRHPRDDCVHVATNADAARREGLIDDPNAYFRGLSRDEQDRMLGKAAAQAVRDGADLNQVVNARRGMQTAQVFGQELQITTEGTTTRGFAGQRLIAEGARVSREQAEFVRRRSRFGEVGRRVSRQRVQTPRLTPESIYRFAKDREDALRLLKRFGYIL